ncbi:MAG: hypothetical protein R6T98_09375 [Desulfatiglandales bacterium]
MEGCCLFVMYPWGKPQAPIYRGNAEGAKLPHGYVAEKTSPGAPELKKKPIVFRSRGIMQRSRTIILRPWVYYPQRE